MNHSFDIEVAEIVGVEGAILFANIQHWVERNRVNGENLKEGEAWVYNSRSAWCELFPYLGEKQIRNALEKLIEAELIKRDTFSYGSVNRTYWYTLAEKAKPFGRKGQTKGSDQKAKPKTVIDTVIDKNSPKPPAGSGGMMEEDSVFMDLVKAYGDIRPDRVDAPKAWGVWKAEKLADHADAIRSALPVFEASKSWKEGYVPNLSRWLSEQGWKAVAAGLPTPDELKTRERAGKAEQDAYAKVQRDRVMGWQSTPAEIEASNRYLARTMPAAKPRAPDA